MIVISTQTAAAVLCICSFILGVILDRVAIWFYNRYFVTYEEDDSFCDECNYCVK